MNRTLTISASLQYMKEARTCPPMAMLAEGGPFAEKHLKSCVSCQEKLKRYDIYKSLSSASIPSEPPSPPKKTGALAGEVYLLSRRGIPLFGKAFYNEPFVLVVQDETEIGIPGLVRVAPIFDMPALAAAGDVPLASWRDDWHCEAWNTFPVAVYSLGGLLCTVTPEELEAVKRAASEEQSALPKGSAVSRFRALERGLNDYFGELGRQMIESSPPKESPRKQANCWPMEEVLRKLGDRPVPVYKYSHAAMSDTAFDISVNVISPNGTAEQLKGKAEVGSNLRGDWMQINLHWERAEKPIRAAILYSDSMFDIKMRCADNELCLVHSFEDAGMPPIDQLAIIVFTE